MRLAHEKPGQTLQATSNGDYIGKTGTLTFAPGETTKIITIEVKGDSKKEANETFYLDLFGNTKPTEGLLRRVARSGDRATTRRLPTPEN